MQCDFFWWVVFIGWVLPWWGKAADESEGAGRQEERSHWTADATLVGSCQAFSLSSLFGVGWSKQFLACLSSWTRRSDRQTIWLLSVQKHDLSVSLLRGWLLRELVFRAQQVLGVGPEKLMDISGYYATPFCALFPLVSDYNVVGAHLGPITQNFAPRIRFAP